MGKTNTLKTYQERMVKVLVYLEQHLEKELTIEELSNVSCFSRFHFQRIFSAAVGESVYGYLRRLRIQKAARLIVYSDKSITEIALSVGYASSSSFTKAFKNVVGQNPQALRNARKLPDLHPVSQQLIHYQEVKMKHRIEERKEQTMLFLRKTGAYEKAAPAAWRQIVEFAHQKGICLKTYPLVGFALDDPTITDEPHLRFDIGILGLKEPKAEGLLGLQTLAGGPYAVFEHHDHYNCLSDTFAEIYGYYLPKNDLEPRDEHPFCHYLEGETPLFSLSTDQQKSGQKTLIYIPI